MMETMEYFGDKDDVRILRPQIKEFIRDKTKEESFVMLYGGRNVGKTFQVEWMTVEDLLSEIEQNKDRFEIMCLYPKASAITDSFVRGHWEKMMTKIYGKTPQRKYTKEGVYIKVGKEKEWRKFCHVHWLGDAENLKFENFPAVRYIFIDEIMKNDMSLAKARKCIEYILTYYETIDRHEDRVKIIMCGNVYNPADPMFELFEVPIEHLKSEYTGLVTRTLNRAAWYVPKPPNTDTVDGENESRFSKMIKTMPYGKISAGEFEADYGPIVQAPQTANVEIITLIGIELERGCYMAIATLSDGLTYLESVSEDFFDTIPRRYVTSYNRATIEKPYVTAEVINYIKKKASKGRLRIVDVESVVQLAGRIRERLNIRLI